LATAIQHEKPELEVRKTELLRKEEELKIELAKLEDQLLEVWRIFKKKNNEFTNFLL
jgi:hypothetical protein